MSWHRTDLASYGDGCLVEILDEDEDGMFTVEVIECEDGTLSGIIDGISSDELSAVSEEDEELYE